MTFAAGIFIGLIVGACFGALIMAIMWSSADVDKMRRPH
jgi:hypothetical protein